MMCILPDGERCELAKALQPEPDPARDLVDTFRAIHSQLWNVAAREVRSGFPGAGRYVGVGSGNNQEIVIWGLELYRALLASPEWIAGRDGAVVCADSRRLSLGGHE